MAKYFVTGATGFIGGEIVKQLIGRGHKVVALVRAPERAAMLKALGVEMHPGDITDRETLKTPMTGVDGVFHVAAWYKVGVKEPLADQINVDGTRNVLQTMRALEIPRGVYTSTVAVFSDTKGTVPDETYRYDGPHLSHYDRTKWIAHYRVAAAENGRRAAALDRDARHGLRSRRYQRHAHRAGRPVARPPADDAGAHRLLLGARRRHRARPHPGDGKRPAR